jgi:endoglucanase
MQPAAGALAIGLLLSLTGCAAVQAHPPVPAVTRSADPLAVLPLYDDPDSLAATAGIHAARTPAAVAAARHIASVPVATWFTGTATGPELTGQVRSLLARAAGAHALPVLVAYDIPHRDCGDFSSGGAPDAAAYRSFVASFAAGLGASPAAVIVEPDAVSHLDECGLGTSGEQQRSALLTDAVDAFAARPHTEVYLDAGSSGWHSAAEMTTRLEASGLAAARGFALNVADFKATSDVLAFGRALAARTGKDFVVDTSRNGSGPWEVAASRLPWCNPPGRTLGRPPTADTGVPRLDAYLWVKSPGISDGQCDRGDPPAGAWFAAYAVALVGSGA